MKTLVTGGAGYIGSTLTPLLLKQGHQVRVLDSLLHGGTSMLGFWAHPRFEFVQGDIRDTSAVAKALEGVDAVVHLAAIVGDPACARDPDLSRAVNQRASLELLDACRRRGVQRFVFASTCSNYGQMSDPTLYADESWELNPLSLYSETKVAVEEAILDLPDSNMTATMLRFATAFGVGSRMRFDLTVNEFTLDLITKQNLVVFGEQFWRPYAHIADLARGVALILESPEEKVGGQVFNVGATDQNFQKQGLLELIHPYAPGAKIEFVRRDEDPRDYRVSFDKINDTLGYSIEHTVADGVREVAELIKSGIIENYDEPIYRN